jgi:hypothetical protein
MATDQLLDVLLNCKRASHFADVLNFPVPQLAVFAADSVSAYSSLHSNYNYNSSSSIGLLPLS